MRDLAKPTSAAQADRYARYCEFRERGIKDSAVLMTELGVSDSTLKRYRLAYQRARGIEITKQMRTSHRDYDFPGR